MQKVIYLLLLFHIYSCDGFNKTINSEEQNPIENKTPKGIVIQPFGDVPFEYISYIQRGVYKINRNIHVQKSIPLPKSSYFKNRNRYRADSLIKFLQQRTKKEQITVGVTIKDISNTKGKIEDYGIMGLGFVNGNSCIVSSFRLSFNNRKEQLLKLVLHEIGHTEGLRHCDKSNCLMRDCGGKNHWDEENGFCENCKIILIKRGWYFGKT